MLGKKREEQLGDWLISDSDRRGLKRIERLKPYKMERLSRRVLRRVNGVYDGSEDESITPES